MDKSRATFELHTTMRCGWCNAEFTMLSEIAWAETLDPHVTFEIDHAHGCRYLTARTA